MRDAAPRDLGDVDETFDASKIDEDPEAGDVCDRSVRDLPRLQGREERHAPARSSESGALAEDKPSALGVELDDLERQFPPDHAGERFR